MNQTMGLYEIKKEINLKRKEKHQRLSPGALQHLEVREIRENQQDTETELPDA